MTGLRLLKLLRQRAQGPRGYWNVEGSSVNLLTHFAKCFQSLNDDLI